MLSNFYLVLLRMEFLLNFLNQCLSYLMQGKIPLLKKLTKKLTEPFILSKKI